MGMREKLAELLCEAHSKAIDEILSDDISYAQQLEIEADHLIAHGVTIPVRCKDCAKREFSAFDGCEWCDPCGYKCIDPEWYCPKGVRK